MRNFKSALEQDIQLQRKLLKEHEKELAKLPQGSLSLYRSGAKNYQKYTVKKAGKRMQRNVRETEHELIAALCKKAFLKKQVNIMKSNLKIQEKIMDVYQPYSTKHILTQLKPIYAKGVHFSGIEGELHRKQSEAISLAVHPDFIIYLDNGERIIWEHLGMLSSDSYAEAQMKKLQAYHLAGYTLGKNLFITADNADGILDVTVISRIVDEICERGGCY